MNYYSYLKILCRNSSGTVYKTTSRGNLKIPPFWCLGSNLSLEIVSIPNKTTDNIFSNINSLHNQGIVLGVDRTFFTALIYLHPKQSCYTVKKDQNVDVYHVECRVKHHRQGLDGHAVPIPEIFFCDKVYTVPLRVYETFDRIFENMPEYFYEGMDELSCYEDKMHEKYISEAVSIQTLMKTCFYYDNLCYTIHQRTKSDSHHDCLSQTFETQTAAPLLTPEARQFIMNVLGSVRTDYVQNNRDLFSVRVGLSRFKTGNSFLDNTPHNG